MNITERICYNLSTWRLNPTELTNRATYSDDPENFGKQKHRFHEAVLFFSRLGLRPLTMACLRHVYKSVGLVPVGFGYFTIALRRDKSVIKIYEFTVKNNDNQRIELEKSINSRLKIVNRYLGEYVTKTKATIEAHPILNTACVTIHQPYVEGKLLDKKPYAKYLKTENLASYKILLDKAIKMHQETGYLLDVNGHNLIETSSGVVVIDTIIMGKVDVKMRPKTLKTLKQELSYIEKL